MVENLFRILETFSDEYYLWFSKNWKEIQKNPSSSKIKAWAEERKQRMQDFTKSTGRDRNVILGALHEMNKVLRQDKYETLIADYTRWG